MITARSITSALLEDDEIIDPKAYAMAVPYKWAIAYTDETATWWLTAKGQEYFGGYRRDSSDLWTSEPKDVVSNRDKGYMDQLARKIARRFGRVDVGKVYVTLAP